MLSHIKPGHGAKVGDRCSRPPLDHLPDPFPDRSHTSTQPPSETPRPSSIHPSQTPSQTPPHFLRPPPIPKPRTPPTTRHIQTVASASLETSAGVDSGSAGADDTHGRDGETEMSLRSSVRTFKTATGARLKVPSSRSLAVSADLPVLRRSSASGGADAASSGDSDISRRETCEEREDG